MADGKKLRYIAGIESGIAKVELTDGGESNPFYTLKGSENCIIFTTKYYQQYPMVIKGPGAGVDVTAAGLLADIIRIAEGIRV
jgi:aspartokinase/homoserine dehydrogenase 1